MRAALVLSPKPMPSQMPAHRAMTFFRAAPSSTPTTSSEAYTRNRSFINRSCTCSAAALSREAETTTVGTRRPTSSAWEGPESATMGLCSPSS